MIIYDIMYMSDYSLIIRLYYELSAIQSDYRII